MMFDYIRQGQEIYQRSFAIIRQEADLSNVPSDLEKVAVRLIHSCGMVDIVDDLVASPQAGRVGRLALAQGAPILCDAQMVVKGITRSRLPCDNDIICTLDAPDIGQMATERETTRSAAAVDLWLPYLEGAVVAIGNAPTALFRLLELLEEGAAKPALILGFAVGFVGAAESKQALAENQCHVPFITLHGRRGGSAMAVAAVNALASERE